MARVAPFFDLELLYQARLLVAIAVLMASSSHSATSGAGEDEEVRRKPVRERAMSSITKLMIQGSLCLYLRASSFVSVCVFPCCMLFLQGFEVLVLVMSRRL